MLLLQMVLTGQISVDHVKVAHQLPIATPQERVEKAHKFLGLPYLWGGTSSHGYDCSGFMYRIFAAGGIRIPRDASVQAQYGENIPLDQIKPGDLLFFAYEKGQGRIHHVGMYIGDNSFIHSPRTGQPIKVNRLTDAPYEEELCVARRYHGDEVFDENEIKDNIRIKSSCNSFPFLSSSSPFIKREKIKRISSPASR